MMKAFLCNSQLEPELLQSLDKVAEIGLQSGERKKKMSDTRTDRVKETVLSDLCVVFFSSMAALCVFSGLNASSR